MSWVCEFQKIVNGESFGRADGFRSRADAASYALEKLTALGETEKNSRNAVEVAGYSWADTRAHGYGVRIFEE